jgi:hypothetical protein
MIIRLIPDLEQRGGVVQNSWEGEMACIMSQRAGAVGEFCGTSGGEAWTEMELFTNIILK